MGFSIAEKLAEEGALVTVISGPSACQTIHPNINRINVISAQEMYDAALENFPDSDGAIMTAAVADFTPLNPVDAKVKREKSNYTIELTPTRDIAASIGSIKSDNQFLVGFALETNNEEQNAQLKLEKKNLDLIVLNSLNDSGAGFQHDTNKITIFSRKGDVKRFDLKPKSEVAKDIVDELILNQNY